METIQKLRLVDYLPFRLEKRGITILGIVISVDLAQYEIFRAEVCDFRQKWYDPLIFFLHKTHTIYILYDCTAIRNTDYRNVSTQ